MNSVMTLKGASLNRPINSYCKYAPSSNSRTKPAFRPILCRSKAEKQRSSEDPDVLAGIRSTATGILVSGAAWLAPPAMAMQDLATDMATDLELGLGADMMPDTSWVTMATLVYCSLAFLSVFLQPEEEADSSSKANTESKASTGEATSKQAAMYQATAATSSAPHSAAVGSSCTTFKEARVKQLAETATASVSLAIRDARYLLQQIVPDHMHAACNGAPPTSHTLIRAPVAGALSMRGVEEVEVRDWLHGLSEAYLVAKQKSTGLARETAARVVLNNQDAAVRDMSRLVAREAAVMAAINIFNVMEVDSTFENRGGPLVSSASTKKST